MTRDLKTFFVYILSNKSRRTYVGFTSELQVRTFKHMHKWYPDSFTARYNYDMVVYVERYLDPNYAIAREKEIKKWRRAKKLRLILAVNPDWADLSAEWREDESWQAIPDAKPRFVLRRRPRKT
jgi:putative endonuclease